MPNAKAKSVKKKHRKRVARMKQKRKELREKGAKPEPTKQG